jgi:hypothetical protein
MTFEKIQALATYHFDAATNNFQLANRMEGDVAVKIRERAAAHQKFAEELRGLVAPESVIDLTLEEARHGMAMQAKVIAAMESERRELLERIASLQMERKT